MLWIGIFFPSLTDSLVCKSLKDSVTQIAYGYSNHLHWMDDCTIVIEIERSFTIYKGRRSLLKQLHHQIEALEYICQYGAAPNATAASLMASHSILCWNQDDLEQQLSSWPTPNLPLPSKVIDELLRCGLKTVGHLRAQASDQRIRRFGTALHQYIERLYGNLPTLISYWKPKNEYYRRIDLPHAVENTKHLEHQIQYALTHLDDWLIKNDRVLSHLILRCKHEPSHDLTYPDLVIKIGLSQPSSNKVHLENLIKLKLENLLVKKPLVTLIIQCQSIQNYQPPQSDLLDRRLHNHSWADLIDHLRIRLGKDSVCKVTPKPHHQPEKSWAWHTEDTNSMYDVKPTQRPTWILPTPITLDPKPLTLESGPERIESDWWNDSFCQRDYWVAVEPNGRRIWIFHEHQPRTGWFIHGIFG